MSMRNARNRTNRRLCNLSLRSHEYLPLHLSQRYEYVTTAQFVHEMAEPNRAEFVIDWRQHTGGISSNTSCYPPRFGARARFLHLQIAHRLLRRVLLVIVLLQQVIGKALRRAALRDGRLGSRFQRRDFRLTRFCGEVAGFLNTSFHIGTIRQPTLDAHDDCVPHRVLRTSSQPLKFLVARVSNFAGSMPSTVKRIPFKSLVDIRHFGNLRRSWCASQASQPI